MDPEANLKELLELAEEMLSGDQDNYDLEEVYEIAEKSSRMAELIQALDGWIKGGGFLPSSWNKNAPDVKPAAASDHDTEMLKQIGEYKERISELEYEKDLLRGKNGDLQEKIDRAKEALE